MAEYLSSLLATASTKVLTMCGMRSCSVSNLFVTLDGGLSHLFVHVVVNERNKLGNKFNREF